MPLHENTHQQNIPEHEKMSTLQQRFRTFNSGWCIDFLSPMEMAKAGFIYSGIKDFVKCLFCSQEFYGWKEGEDPLAEHMYHSPHCTFVCEAKKIVQVATLENRLGTFDDRWHVQFLRSIEMAKAGFIYLGIQDRVKCLSCSKDFDNWQQGDDPLAEHKLQSPECPFVRDPINNQQITTLKNRLETFNDGWSVEFLRPFHMAQAGFIYLGIQGHVKCFSCSKDFVDWQEGDDPLSKHVLHSPECSFVREPTIGHDVCGLYGIDRYGASIKEKIVQDCLDSIGIIHKLNTIECTKYATLDARLKSFKICLKSLKKDINTYCEAGFFYIGDGTNDIMSCFYCGIFLHNWEDDDEPWSEHAKFSKDCCYLLLNKGKIFVDKICRANIDFDKSSKMMLAKLIAEHDGSYTLGTGMKIHSTKKILNLLQNTDLSDINISSDNNQHLSQARVSNTIPDSMLCKICYKEEIKVAFVPCGHAIACIHCALTIEQCAVCRHPFEKAMRIYLSTKKDLELELHGSSKCSDKKLSTTLCRVCHNEEMVAAFIPCRHVYACVKCAKEMHECPVCTESVYIFIQLYV